jgi:hypothetical protein
VLDREATMVPHDAFGGRSTPAGRPAYARADGATSRRTSVAGTHAVDPVEAKGLRLEVVVGAWPRSVAPERGSGPTAGQETTR